jgi:uncharacterized protein YbaR (Trm112 family)
VQLICPKCRQIVTSLYERRPKAAGYFRSEFVICEGCDLLFRIRLDEAVFDSLPRILPTKGARVHESTIAR